MFKNFQLNFSTRTQFLLGWSREGTGVTSTVHSIYIGPFVIGISVRNQG